MFNVMRAACSLCFIFFSLHCGLFSKLLIEIWKSFGLDFNSKSSKMIFRFKRTTILTMILSIFCWNLYQHSPPLLYFLYTYFSSLFSLIPSSRCLTFSIKQTWFSIHLLPHLWHLVLFGTFSPDVPSSINQCLHYYYSGIRS